MTAAAHLEQQGKHVILIESEDRVGGAAVSETLGGGNVPLGSVYFIERTDELDLLFQLGGVEPVPCPPDGYDFGAGGVVQDLWADATLDRVIRNDRERDGMKRFRDLILAMGDDVPPYPLPETLTPAMAALDVSAEEWVRGFKSQHLHTVLESYARSSMGGLLSRTNVYCLQNFYSCEFGEAFDLPRYTIPGGTGTLTSSVLPHLHDVRLGEIAVRVRRKGAGAEVDTVDQDGRVVRYTAGSVVVAAPKFQMPALIEDLSDNQERACRQLAYAPYIAGGQTLPRGSLTPRRHRSRHQFARSMHGDGGTVWWYPHRGLIRDRPNRLHALLGRSILRMRIATPPQPSRMLPFTVPGQPGSASTADQSF